MRRLLEQYINSSRKIIIDTYELENDLKKKLGEGYSGEGRLVEELRMLIEEGILLPVVSRKHYRGSADLYGGYRIIKRIQKSRSPLMKDLTALHPLISTSIYEHNPEKLQRDLKYVKIIDTFLKQKGKEQERLTVNQRSFRLFRDEHFLARRKGIRLLQDLALTFDDLDCYQPAEPFVYTYWGGKERINRLLIVENADMYHLLQKLELPKGQADSTKIDLIVYGDGDRIERSLPYCDELPFWQMSEKQLYYFGDLSYDRFSFLGRLRRRYPYISIEPYVPCYHWLLEKHAAEAVFQRTMNRTVEKDQEVARILPFFAKDIAERIHRLFRSGRYIPQIALDKKTLQQIFCKNDPLGSD